MSRPILKYILVGALASLVLLSILTQPDHKELNLSRVAPNVLESNALYFKNMRQFYYNSSEDEKSGFTIFSHPDQKNLSALSPRLEIVDNWRRDEAYILFDLDESIRSNAELVVKHSKQLSRYNLENLNAPKSLELAVKLYESLGDDSASFVIERDGQEVMVWASIDERSILRTILKDYFRLIGAL